MRRFVHLWLVLLVCVTASGSEVTFSSTEVAETEPTSSCVVQAWVRAQDLSPGAIVHGDVRVKSVGDCDVITGTSLGLRFAERSAVKFARPGLELPSRPDPKIQDVSRHSSIYSNMGMVDDILAVRYDVFPSFRRAPDNFTAWDEYQSLMRNVSLWVLKEQERIAFDIQQPLSVRSTDHQESFALLVPNTNYPPVVDATSFSHLADNGMDEGTNAAAESMYLYYVQLSFRNGSTTELPCGYTAFIPVRENAVELSMKQFNVTLTSSEHHRSTASNSMSLDLSFSIPSHDNVPAIVQGTSFEANAIVLSTNKSLSGTLHSLWSRIDLNHSLNWASSLAAERLNGSNIMMSIYSTQQLVAPIAALRYGNDYDYRARHLRQFETHIWDIEPAHNPADVLLPLDIGENAFPSFEAFYSHSSTALQISAVFSPGHLSSEEANEQQILDLWTPEDMANSFPPYADETAIYLQGSIPARLLSSRSHDGSAPTDYRSDEARSPTFVDIIRAAELQRMSIDERDCLAPLAEPRFVDFSGEDVKLYRYRSLLSSGSFSDVYVGVTWQRKVVDRGGHPRVQLGFDGVADRDTPLTVQIDV